VLSSLGIEEGQGPIRIETWNKVDLLSEEERQALFAEADRRTDVVAISALSGWGMQSLRERISETLQRDTQIHQIRLDASEGSRLAWLHARGEVIEQRVDRDILTISVRLSPDNWARFQAIESA
jgi:GTP-binding protein HflX